jgi:urease accessory protein UreE
MQIIDHVVKAASPGDRPIVDCVFLTWDVRQKSRQKLQTAAGKEVALALPTGTRRAIYYPSRKDGSKSIWLPKMFC